MERQRTPLYRRPTAPCTWPRTPGTGSSGARSPLFLQSPFFSASLHKRTPESSVQRCNLFQLRIRNRLLVRERFIVRLYFKRREKYVRGADREPSLMPKKARQGAKGILNQSWALPAIQTASPFPQSPPVKGAEDNCGILRFAQNDNPGSPPHPCPLPKGQIEGRNCPRGA